MGSYVESVLATGETVVYETKLHWSIYIWGVLLIPVLIGIVVLVITYVIRNSSEFAVTSRRVIVKTGFIARKAFDTSLDKIEGIIIEQGILGRIFDYGTLIVRGTGGSSQPFLLVANPFMFKRMVSEAAEARRNNG